MKRFDLSKVHTFSDAQTLSPTEERGFFERFFLASLFKKKGEMPVPDTDLNAQSSSNNEGEGVVGNNTCGSNNCIQSIVQNNTHGKNIYAQTVTINEFPKELENLLREIIRKGGAV